MTKVLPKNAVITHNNVLMTDSMTVSDVFDRRHNNVLRDINDLISEIKSLEATESLRSSILSSSEMFIESEYEITNNLGFTIKYPMYLMTEEGFALLVMGYTGKLALQYKLMFLEEFKRRGEAEKLYANAFSLLFPEQDVRELLLRSIKEGSILSLIQASKKISEIVGVRRLMSAVGYKFPTT